MRIITPFDHITEKLIAIGFKVHGAMGGGFAEKIYENGVCIELEEAGLKFERQKRLEVFYRGILVGEYIADVVVEGAVLLELKAVQRIEDEHIAQTINYLTCTGLQVGLLMNFGRSLKFKRLLSKFHFPPPDNPPTIPPT